MSLMSHVEDMLVSEETGHLDLPTASDIEELLQSYLRKRPVKEQALIVRRKLLKAARTLKRDTAAIKRMIRSGQMDAQIEASGKPSQWWSSRLIHMPLLDDAMHQLQTARDVDTMMVAIARLLAIVEDADEPVAVPHISGLGEIEHRRQGIYRYLLGLLGTDKAKKFQTFLRGMAASVAKRLAAQVIDKGVKKVSPGRPRW